MALQYDLTLAGDTPVNQVAARAFPDLDERPVGTAPLVAADLYEKYGFEAIVLADDQGYVEARSDDGIWVWEPGNCASLGFRMDKSADPVWQVANMLTVVRRVLDSGPEDAALTFNDDLLLLTRLDGAVVKHHRETFWQHYPGADVAVPG